MNKVKIIWDDNYSSGRDSGAGSYGCLCEYKADFINKFINDNKCINMLEFGSGDGNQMQYFNILKYTGLDISEYVVNYCKNKYKHLNNKNFITYDEYYKDKCINETYDLAISLDVIYHLIDDNTYIKYMDDLFNSTKKYIIIYSTNFQDETYNGSHVYHRKFTNYINNRYPYAQLIYHEPNKYPLLSTAEMYVYSIQNE